MEEESYKFTYLPKTLPTLCSKDFKQYFEKWYLKDRLRAWCFSFDKSFQHYRKEKFVHDFFHDEVVLANIQAMSPSGAWGYVAPADNVAIEELNSTVTSLNFFDKLKNEGIVRENGSICKCFDEFYEGVTISDELRKMLLLEDSDNFECYSDEERKEFIFKLFFHFVIGGPICQFEDNIQPYLDVTKSLYKDLIAVQRDGETKEMIVLTKAYKVKTMDSKGCMTYPAEEEHDQTFAYLTIDPLKRQAVLLYHAWGKSLW
uniref:cilia- and flagella-associated protein 300-like isoform X1 n=1 Tax=Ciona intestinalis TaxID=7719 RepID=UPI00006A4101|nr:cilia- and flagella-associated protein 300-like isoform X1 [Ciona intestinalis]|eukprot:XP_002132152.1 cilia- and flagella-associated protein 300-like isoform X1 [Ciona intestinalis]